MRHKTIKKKQLLDQGYRPSLVPTSNMNRAPSLRYRASVPGSRPSDWDGVWAKSFLSQYQQGLMWSMIPWPDINRFSLESFIGCGDALNDGPGALGCWVEQKQDGNVW